MKKDFKNIKDQFVIIAIDEIHTLTKDQYDSLKKHTGFSISGHTRKTVLDLLTEDEERETKDD